MLAQTQSTAARPLLVFCFEGLCSNRLAHVQIASKDRDFRYMGTSDLLAELQVCA
jgi:hypothetical protein